ncbi:MAG: hypothetical protein KAS30_00875, partial [Candidatus Diapherotrites archaeon]|nr:hypothetical protein [Candidatus Diapherotrites archaeon]
WLLKFLGKEDKLTIQCSNFLRYNGIVFHHTFNEGKRTRTMQEKVLGFGVMTVIPDILIFHSAGAYKGLAVELKVVYDSGAKNKLSKSQKEAQETLKKQGWKVVTVFNYDEFLLEVKKYF